MVEVKLGDLLRRHRLEPLFIEKDSLTQKDLADMIGCHNSVVSRVERGDQLPTTEYLQRLIERLNLPDEEAQKIWTLYQQESNIPPALLRSERREDWGEAPDVSAFYGRYDDLVTLTRWLDDDNCRLIVLLGMGGIGKTVLATKLARQSADKFEYVIWRSLRNAPPLRELLIECIQILSDQQEIDLPERTDKAITRLIHYLAAQRSLVVLDNAEAILQEGQAGHYRPDYEDYGQLLQRLGESEHQSYVIVTSREKPREVGQLEGEAAPVRSHPLTGLKIEEGRQILAGKSLTGSNEAWEILVQDYSGNPLALNIVAEMIREVYDGDIDDFLTDEAIIFGRIGDVLGEQFARLSALEQSLMYWLAIEREPVSREVLLDNLVEPVTRRDLMVALRSLRRRSLIEQSDAEFTLQNVVMEYMTNSLVEQVCREIAAEDISLFMSHALIKAQARYYIRERQVRLILKSVTNRLLASLSRYEIESKLKNILSILHEGSPLIPGYAAGNVINLLLYLKSDVKGYDFSQLTLWQAYLRGAELHNVDFNTADLAKTVFDEIIDRVISVAFSPDGKLLVAGTANGEVHLWQLNNDKQTLTYEGHSDWVRSVAFSSDGKIIVSGSSDRTIKLWNVSTGQCLNTLVGHNNRVRSVGFSSGDNSLVSGGDDYSIKLWDVRTGHCINTIEGHTRWISSVIFKPNSNIIASGSGDHTIKLWDVVTGKCLRTLQGHTDRVIPLAFSPDGNTLVSGSEDRTVRVWNVNAGQLVRVLNGHTGVIRSVAYSRNGNTCASASDDGTVRLWEVNTGECLRIFKEHTNRVRSVAFHPNGHILASGCEDRTIRLWDTQTGQSLNTIEGYVNPVTSIFLNPASHTFASGSGDGVVRLWDFRTRKCLKSFHGHIGPIQSVACTPDDCLLASSSEDKTIRLWDLHTGNCIRTLRGHTDRIPTVAFSPDGSLVASGSEDKTMKLWDVHTGNCINTLQGHISWITQIVFNTIGSMLISSSFDETVKLWDVHTGECIKTLRGHSNWIRSIALSPDNRVLASGSEDKSIQLWDVVTGQRVKILQGHTDYVRAVIFSPDGRSLASGGNDYSIRIWDVNTGECLKILQGHNNRVRAVAFSSEESVLISSSNDGTIRIWDLQTCNCLEILRLDRPYERMNITGATGLTDAQRASLIALGAIDENMPS